MRFEKTPLDGAYVIALQEHRDERGFFARGWCSREFQEHGLVSRAAQTNISYNRRRGTLRGLHYQRAPHAETKLIRCLRGALWDVIVDLRTDSPTFLQWFGVELNERNRLALYVPEGFAHGFVTLEDDTEALYQVSEFYTPGAEGGLRWDDPALGIGWPLEPVVISDKDAAWPDLPRQRTRTAQGGAA